MLSIIVAKSKNNVIGKDNRLIWYLPDDLKRFKQITTNHNIIMGRKTFESLGKILPNRYHIVLSKDKNFRIESTQVKVINDISLLDKYIESDEENFVIGGASIYKILMPYCKKMYITQIEENFDGDAFFPEIDENMWKIVSRQKGIKDEKNKYDYEYFIYEKKIENCNSKKMVEEK